MAIENEYRLAARIMVLGLEEPGMDPETIAQMIVADRAAAKLEALTELENRVCGSEQCTCWIQVIEKVLRPKYTALLKP